MNANRLCRLVGRRRVAMELGVRVADVRVWCRDDWIPPLMAARLYQLTGHRFTRVMVDRGFAGAPVDFLAYVRPDEGDVCWQWAGFIDKSGSARFRWGNRQYRAQRLAVEIDTGVPVPRDRVVVPTCGDKACVNPDHLRTYSRVEARREIGMGIAG